MTMEYIYDPDYSHHNSYDPLDTSSNYTSVFSKGTPCVEYFTSHYQTDGCDFLTRKLLRQIDYLCASSYFATPVFYSSILAFGVPGCIFTLMTVSRMPQKPSTVYIAVLAVADLLSAISTSYENLFSDIFDHIFLEITFEYYVAPLSTTLSHWVLALVCVERFISVSLPLQKTKIYTMKNTWISLGIALFMSSITLFMDSLGVSGLIEYSQLHPYSSAIYISLYVFAPGLTIITLTLLNAYHLKKIQHRRRIMTSIESSGSKMESDLNQMMFNTAVCFIFLSLPQSVVIIFDKYAYWNLKHCPLQAAIYYFIYDFVVNISNFNHAINFYIYYVGAAGFRRQFHRAISCKGNKTQVKQPDKLSK